MHTNQWMRHPRDRGRTIVDLPHRPVGAAISPDLFSLATLLGDRTSDAEALTDPSTGTSATPSCCTATTPFFKIGFTRILQPESCPNPPNKKTAKLSAVVWDSAFCCVSDNREAARKRSRQSRDRTVLEREKKNTNSKPKKGG